MNLIDQITHSYSTFLSSTFGISPEQARTASFTLNTDENKREFGDLNSNAAMTLARTLKRNPKQIAQEIIEQFKHPAIERMDIAGAGFINATITPQGWIDLARDMADANSSFFKYQLAQPQTINIEFVSANPTGPLHFGHGRSGIIGDVLGNILAFLGHDVTKEFYINDAGNQIQKLGQSFKIRCMQQLGSAVELPEDGYHGEYLIDLAQEAIAEYGAQIATNDEQFFANYAKDILLDRIKQTLIHYGITFDQWFSEKRLHVGGAIDDAVRILTQRGHTFEQDGALWFRATTFGDDKDRVIRKSTGEWTYVAADIAYLMNKIERGANPIMMVLGHDHHSYATRLESIRKALGYDAITLDIILYQLVRMKNEGELVKLSKRAGTMITLDDVISAVGKDVARFFYLHRKADAHLEFDLELARKKTDENPVYYIQYAYVRICSILAKASQTEEYNTISAADLAGLTSDDTALLKKIASLKQLLAEIATNQQSHLLSYYVIELADLYHSYYAKHRIIDLANPAQSRSRLMLMQLLKQTFKTCFDLLGISSPESM